MKKLIVLFLGVLLSAFTVSAGNYEVNEQAIDQLFQQSTEISVLTLENTADVFGINDLANASGLTISNDNTDTWIAFALCWFFGGIGIHRVFMGGKASLILIYFITCGGIFGVVTLLDWISLLIKGIKGEGVGGFQDNDKFFAFEF